MGDILGNQHLLPVTTVVVAHWVVMSWFDESGGKQGKRESESWRRADLHGGAQERRGGSLMTNNVTRDGKGKSQESAGTLPDALKSLLCVKTPPTACAVLSVCVRDDPYFRQNCNETSHRLVLQTYRARQLRQVPLKSPHYHFLLTSTLPDAN